MPVSKIVSGLSVVKVLAMAKDAVKEIRAKTERVGRLFAFAFSFEIFYTPILE